MLALQICLLALSLPVQAPPASSARDGPVPRREPTRFLELQRGEQGEPIALRTATVRYRPAEGDLVVDLIGVVHIGDADYYRELNRSFRQYDALLYELVAPPGLEVPGRDGPQDEGIFTALLQEVGAAYLGLTSQVGQIDYTPENFVHADLSPREMVEAWEKRGESGLTLALGMLADMLRQANLELLEEPHAEDAAHERELAELDLLELLLDPDGGSKMKRLMAVELARQVQAGQLGRTLDAILIEDRNEAAMRVFLQELAKGKKRIGIFYGAAHMPDFERRLVLELGLRRDRVRWTSAWDLRKPSGTSLGTVFRMMGDLLDAGADR